MLFLKKVKFVVGLSLIIFISFIAYKYDHHIVNLYYYTFHHGPYINRVFYTQRIIIKPQSADDSFYRKLITDSDYDDRRWGTADFNRPFEEQLTINYAPTGMKNYKKFIANFKKEFSNDKNKLSDEIVDRLKRFIHLNWQKIRKSPEFDPDNVIEEIKNKPERNRNPEDIIYWFVNYKCACGTISETAVALLRELGFKTRLMRISKEQNKELANHVFLEYYSVESKKWVMFDAMENFIPKLDGKLLSSLEFFLSPRQEDLFKRNKQLYPYSNWAAEIWFEINGPIKKILALSLRTSVESA